MRNARECRWRQAANTAVLVACLMLVGLLAPLQAESV